jgi:ABC-type multidrug transport system ATPase subunit
LKTVGSLSLGNKRKLSTALAFVGNPSVVLLDEPTSGMDPVSRRNLWQEIINLTRRKNCSVLLTSHSMEEVQVLSTRLAIMVEGKFKCMGSVQHLKTKFGDGYTLTVKIKDMPKHLVDEDEKNDEEKKHFKNRYISSILTALKENICAECKLKKRHFNNIYQFELPYSHSCKNFDIGSIYRLIELNKLRFNLVDYSLSQNTLDNVFVNFVKEQTQAASKRFKKVPDNNNESNNEIEDEMHQNYVDDEAEEENSQRQFTLNSSNNIQFPIHDNDDLLIGFVENNRADFNITSHLNDQHNSLSQFSNVS